MPINDRAGYTWDKGIYLASRTKNNYSINLYHLDKFFVEVYYNPEMNYLEKIRSFKSKKCLEVYLDKIILPV